MILSLLTTDWLYSKERTNQTHLNKERLAMATSTSTTTTRKIPIFNHNNNNNNTILVSSSTRSKFDVKTTTEFFQIHVPLEIMEATYGLWKMCKVKGRRNNVIDQLTEKSLFYRKNIIKTKIPFLKNSIVWKNFFEFSSFP